jgi:hypothetical protein
MAGSVFRDHPAIIITVGATSLALIGIVHDFILLAEFGINNFFYAEASNLIVSAGKIVEFIPLPEWIIITYGVYLYIIFILTSFFWKNSSTSVILLLYLRVMIAQMTNQNRRAYRIQI